MTEIARELNHTLTMVGRERLCVTGVTEVDSFDEETVVMLTSKGKLVLRGQGLHIEKLSVDIGELSVEGFVRSLEYSDDIRSGGGFLARLFG